MSHRRRRQYLRRLYRYTFRWGNLKWPQAGEFGWPPGAEHYGFTEEELDFVINYDIKYRMGRDVPDEDE